MELPVIILYGVFFFALGACVGSFLNVVIWRLPNRGREVIYREKRGRMTLSWPPSHCPVCDAKIRWYQNIPVVSWLGLRAKCANCATHIPVRYPLVELGTGVLFAGFFLAYFVGHWQPGFTDVRDWRQSGALGVHLFMIASLLAASGIDADIFEIPLSIPWLMMAVGVAAATLIDHRTFNEIGRQGWWMAKPILGGVVGVVVANVLLELKVLPRSFSAEYMEASRLEAEKAGGAGGVRTVEGEEGKEAAMAPPPKLTRFGASAWATGILLLAAILAWAIFPVKGAALVDVGAGIVIFLIGVLPRDAGEVDVTAEVMEEISSAHVRREVLKEGLFLLVPVVCAGAAYWIPGELAMSGWMGRLLGSLLGILVGGGIVWVVRLGGTLGFNKEAMGMGDAHLMAGVGAIIGAPLVIFAFFAAPLVAILWAIVLKLMGRANVLPYGPWLSVASIMALLVGNPFYAWYLTVLFP